MPEKSMENIYENVFGEKERILNNVYFGEYKKPKEHIAKNEVRTRIKKEYDESYKEKTINTENMVLKTIKETESNINKVFKNIFDEKNSNDLDDDFFANGSVLPDKPLATAPKRNVAIKKEIEYISDDDF